MSFGGRDAINPLAGLREQTPCDQTVVAFCAECGFESQQVADLLEHARAHGWTVVRMFGPVGESVPTSPRCWRLITVDGGDVRQCVLRRWHAGVCR